RTLSASLPEEQVRAIIDRASAVSDVTVSRKGANPPWAHELS
ncbi:MAG: carbohydrate kinase, partial [Pauljensenia sp.]